MKYLVLAGLLATFITLTPCSTFAGTGDPKYPVSEISPELLKNVNAVVRKDEMVFTILAKDKAKLYSYYAITILNQKAKDFAERVLAYDKLRKIKDIKASVYDATGKQIKRLKANEVSDQSAFDGYTLFSDDRLKIIDLAQTVYPYTVEIEYEEEYNFLFYIDGSEIIPDEKVSVERFSYTLKFPKELEPRYKLLNIEGQPKKETVDGFESVTWSFKNLLPMKREPHSPSHFPEIIAAPVQFQFDRYAGSLSSWNDFGQWISLLNKGRNKLPEETVAAMRKLSEAKATREEKIKAVYEYVQNKTRYVGIQLGIGGYQPFEATTVDVNGYGDCKALSNYTVSLLETIGIKSHYALIKAGPAYNGLREDFPSSQFNHAIVAVPNGKDTIWLECTSQTNPFGYQGKFTGDRKALLITDNGAAIVNTTKYPVEQNLQSRKADVTFDLSGNAVATVQTAYSGLQYENDNLDYILTNHKEDQKKWLQKHIEIPSFEIRSFTMQNKKARNPEANIEMVLDLKRFATVNGKRIFVNPNLMNRLSYVPEIVEQRKTPVVLRSGAVDVDTIVYHFNDQIYPEALPKPIKLSSKYGEYQANFTASNGTLIYTRRVKYNKGEFPAESYNEMVEFYRNVSKADNTKVVFLNKT
jgi:hypothetical protein